MKAIELILKLNTSRDTVARAIIAQLAKLPRPPVTELMAAARDPSMPNIRKWSLQALGMLGNRRAGTLLLKALRDERMTIRLHAIRGLAQMGYTPAGNELILLLKDPSGGIRVNAVDALVLLRIKAAGSALCKLLDDEQWYVRQHASQACGELQVTRSIPKLKKLAKTDPKKAVHGAAREALALLSR